MPSSSYVLDMWKVYSRRETQNKQKKSKINESEYRSIQLSPLTAGAAYILVFIFY